jgi:hypothetical protein
MHGEIVAEQDRQELGRQRPEDDGCQDGRGQGHGEQPPPGQAGAEGHRRDPGQELRERPSQHDEAQQQEG